MSVTHWLLVALVVLVLFGGSKLGDIGKGLGEGIKNFKKGLAEDDKPEPRPPAPEPPRVTDAKVVGEKPVAPEDQAGADQARAEKQGES